MLFRHFPSKLSDTTGQHPPGIIAWKMLPRKCRPAFLYNKSLLLDWISHADSPLSSSSSSYNFRISSQISKSDLYLSNHTRRTQNTMEGTSHKTLSSSSLFLPAGFVGFFFACGFLQWVLRFQNLHYLVMFFCQLKGAFSVAESKGRQGGGTERERARDTTAATEHHFCHNEDGDVLEVRSRDVEVVMAKIGMSCDGDGEKMKECLGSDELSVLFEEKEPSLEEVKEAFDVFDENGDGFVDARELQRVLCNLGFKEALNFHACVGMIRAFDTDGDNRIDFNEFVIFMENSFC